MVYFFHTGSGVASAREFQLRDECQHIEAMVRGFSIARDYEHIGARSQGNSGRVMRNRKSQWPSTL